MKKILFVLLALTLVFGLCACATTTDESKAPSDADVSKTESKEESKEASKEESTPASLPEFVVKVVDAEGNPIEGAMIQVCKDTCVPMKSNAEGKAIFNITVTDGYKLSVLACPAGYEYTGEAEVYLESGITEYTVELAKVVSE
jgi:hypothetical protein